MRRIGRIVLGLALAVVGTIARGQANVPPPTEYQIVDIGANQQVWQRETYEAGPDGQVITNSQKYTEVASGLNYLNSLGQWIPSQDLIQPNAAGAVATQGPYQVIFANDVNTAGAIDVQTVDGKRLTSNLIGLAFYDTATGTNVVIAQIQDSQGELISSNQVLYTNAFTGVAADIRYTYRKGSFEQDVILRQQLPAPQAYGLNADTTELEVMTAFLNPPQATISPGTQQFNGDVDQNISWGATSLGYGRAFDLGETSSLHPAVPVIRQYAEVGGQKVLLEKVPLAMIQPFLQDLPQQASLQTNRRMIASKTLTLPPVPSAQSVRKPMKIASTPPSRKGYVLDYVQLSSAQSNMVFQGDTTYYISSAVNLSGSITFEGNTVIKYASGAALNALYGSSLTCLTLPYRKAILTAIDDDSVGTQISGSTGTPSGYYANPALSDASSDFVWSNIRICYASVGLSSSSGSATISFNDDQFLDCQEGLEPNATVYLLNVLFANISDTCINSLPNAINIDMENTTFANVQTLEKCNTSGSVWYSENNIFANVTNMFSGITPAGAHNGFYNSSSSGFGSLLFSSSAYPFQTAGAGSYYLATNSAFHNVGATTNISAETLADIAVKTTYPPLVFSNYTIPSVTNYSPQVPRDNGVNPDLGYHYDPLDEAFGGCVAPSNLNFTAGTAVGWFYSGGGIYGIAVGDSATASFNGTATAPCYWVRYNTVQEGGNGNWTSQSWLTGMTGQSYTHAAPAMTAQFTLFSVPATEAGPFRDDASDDLFVFTGNNCEFYGAGGGGYYLSISDTNCLFVNAAPLLYRNYLSANLTMVNCTCFRGNVEGDNTSGGNWPVCIYNCAFDSTTFYLNPHGGPTNGYYTDYNSFLWSAVLNTNITPYFGGHEVTNITAYNWQRSRFGNYYVPPGSGLVDAGSTTADRLGLAEFTTQTNQTPEGISPVDIGYHYVPVDANGNPLNTQIGGVPDYLADANGNALPDWWELQYYGNYTHFATNLDANGTHTLLYDYQNQLNPREFTNGMVGWWKLSENSRTIAHDSFSTNNGVQTSGNSNLWQNPGLLFRSFSSTDFVSFTNASGNVPAALQVQTFTFTTWVNATNNTGTQGLLGGGSSAFYVPEVRINPANQLELAQECVINMGTSTGTVPLNTLSFVACTYNSGSGAITFYINGTNAGTATSSETFSYPNLGLGFGCGTEALNGVMEDARLYGTVLSSSQIAALYTNGPQVQPYFLRAATAGWGDVSNAISWAVISNYDGVQIPPGITNWASALVITNDISIVGAGTNLTVIVNNVVGNAGFMLSWVTISNGFCRLSGMDIEGSAGGNQGGFSIQISGTCHAVRIDHCRFNLWLTGTMIDFENWVYGVVDHCSFNFLGAGYSGAYIHMDTYGGQQFGDGSWADGDNWGTTNAIYFENCTFFAPSPGAAEALDGVEGARAAVRFCNITNCFLASHGTDNDFRNRGFRSYEVYSNNFLYVPLPNPTSEAILVRSGTGIVYGNIVTNYNSLIGLIDYRYDTYPWPPFNNTTGVNPWDSNNPTNYPGYSGTHTGTNGSPILVDTSQTWTNNQWVNVTQPYFLWEIEQNLGARILSNTSTTISYAGSFQGFDLLCTDCSLLMTNGHHYEIHQVYATLDQAGFGQGDLITNLVVVGVSTNPVNSVTGTQAWPNEVYDPVYEWGDNWATIGGYDPIFISGTIPGSTNGYVSGTYKSSYIPLVYPHPLVR